MRLLATFIISSFILLGVSGCGTKGPLYLPQPAEQSTEAQAQK